MCHSSLKVHITPTILPTQWTWVWASSGRWWRTGKPATVHGAQRVRHDSVTEQQLQIYRIWNDKTVFRGRGLDQGPRNLSFSHGSAIDWISALQEVLSPVWNSVETAHVNWRSGSRTPDGFWNPLQVLNKLVLISSGDKSYWVACLPSLAPRSSRQS